MRVAYNPVNMPDIDTRHFGVVRCHEGAELFFPGGLPAFETAQRFVLIEQPATSPIAFLQSVDSKDLCFPTLPILAVDPTYELAISREDLLELALDDNRQPDIGLEVLCLAIVSVPENCPATANLLAPVVVNLENRRGVQAIRLDTRYKHQHRVVPESAC